MCWNELEKKVLIPRIASKIVSAMLEMFKGPLELSCKQHERPL